MSSMSSVSTPRALQAICGRLNRLAVARHPGLRVNPRVEGFRDYTFGGRAGPCISAVNVFHELAHAAEFGPTQFRSRARAEGFRFKTNRVFIYDRYCDEPSSAQATYRELRTFARQLHLMRMAGYKVTDEVFMGHSAHLMRLMPDWWNVPGPDEQARREHCVTYVATEYASLDAVEVLGSLEVWLDLTWKRIRRKDTQRPWSPVDQRYRTDGSLLETASA